MTAHLDERARLARGLRKELERRLWLVGDHTAPAHNPQEQPAFAPKQRQTDPKEPVSEPKAPLEAPPPTATVESQRELARSATDLTQLRQTVAECRACALCETRTQTVFGHGEGPVRVLFIGEAPGQVEDEQGVPFVGPSGALLTDIIEKGMGLKRSEVAIANVLKCRPPGNRDPEPPEKALCTPFLDRQIELLNPEVLIPLGTHAARHLLDSGDSIGRLRGRVHRRGDRKVVPTYHPSYLLRSPSQKSACWQDIQVAMKELQLPLPGER